MARPSRTDIDLHVMAGITRPLRKRHRLRATITEWLLILIVGGMLVAITVLALALITGTMPKI